MIAVTKAKEKEYKNGDIVAVDEYLGWCEDGSRGVVISSTTADYGWQEKLYYIALDSGKRVWARARNLKLIKEGDTKK